jgi:hypothetical protein
LALGLPEASIKKNCQAQIADWRDFSDNCRIKPRAGHGAPQEAMRTSKAFFLVAARKESFSSKRPEA